MQIDVGEFTNICWHILILLKIEEEKSALYMMTYTNLLMQLKKKNIS
jgi:hypothetical protein